MDVKLGLLHGAIGGALLDLVRTQAVAHAVDDVAGDEGLEQPEEELRVHLQAGLFARRLLQASGLLEQHHAEAVEAGVA